MEFSASFIILMALIGELGFMAASILARRLRTGGTSSRAVLGAYGLTFPLWAGLAAYFALSGQLDVTWPYLLCVLVWLGVCYLLNFGTVFISPFQSLSESTGYRFGFSVLIALAVDLLVFKTTFNPHLLLVLGALFLGGVLLHMARVKQDYSSSRLVPLHYKLGFVVLVSLAEVATYALFKYGASLQDSVFAHNAVMQGALFALFIILGGRVMLRDSRAGYLPTSYILAFMGLVIIAVSADAIAIAGLPVTLFIMFSLIRSAFFAVHDIKTREAPFGITTIAALVLIASGIVMAFLIKGF